MSAVSTPSHVPPSWGVVKLYVRGVRELSIPIFSPITFVNAGVLGIYYRYNSMTVETSGNSNASLRSSLLSIPFHTSSLSSPSLACAPCINSRINEPVRTHQFFSCCFLQIALFSPSASFRRKVFSSTVLLQIAHQLPEELELFSC